MPYKPSDATRHTRKADTPAKQRQWASVTDSLRAAGKPEGEVVKIANGVVKNHPAGGRKRK